MKFGEAYDRHSGEHFPQAVALAAQAAGIAGSPTAAGRKEPKPQAKASIGDVVAAIDKVAAELAPRSNSADLAQLQAKAFSQWDERAAAYWRSRGLDPDIARKYGAGVRRRWQGADRVTFPMTTPDGEVRQFYGRAIEPRPKTWHHPERGEIPTEKAAKSSRAGLGIEEGTGRIGGWFNAPALRSEWAVYIVEGIPDALALIQEGYTGAVAPIGLYLGAYDPRWFTAIGPLPRPVTIAFNRDENGRGQAAAARIKAELEEHLGPMVRVRIVYPPEPFNDWAEMVEARVPIEILKPPPPPTVAPAILDPFAEEDGPAQDDGEYPQNDGDGRADGKDGLFREWAPVGSRDYGRLTIWEKWEACAAAEFPTSGEMGALLRAPWTGATLTEGAKLQALIEAEAITAAQAAAA